MNKSELRERHEREAVRLRSLAADTTTPALRARLVAEAEKHEELVKAKRAGAAETVELSSAA